jgi:hypothetical protein
MESSIVGHANECEREELVDRMISEPAAETGVCAMHGSSR